MGAKDGDVVKRDLFTDALVDLFADGRRLSKKAQVRLAGNSVEHYVAKALFEANLEPQARRARAA
jgi:hypothetical protein